MNESLLYLIIRLRFGNEIEVRGGNEMTIIIKTITGNSIELDFRPQDTVSNLKAMIKDKVGLPEDD